MNKTREKNINIIPVVFVSLTATQKSWRGLGSEAKARKNDIAKSGMDARVLTTIFFMFMQCILKQFFFEEGERNLLAQWTAMVARVCFCCGLVMRVGCLFLAEEAMRCLSFEIVLY